jgi:phage baseplate assembly protein W
MTARYGAWRFTFRGLGGQLAPMGLAVSAKGAIELVSHGDTVRQALLMLVSTRPGERVMRPEYGCYLFRLAFSPNDDTTAGLAIHYVRQAIESWEPRIEILRLDANRNAEHPSRVDIDLQYRLRTLARVEQLTMAVDLASGAVH